jgi:hypothetical protein
MRRPVAPRLLKAGDMDGHLSEDELSIVVSALWMFKGQLGRVGSGQPIPGLATAEACRKIDEIARKLGGDPDAYFYGLQPFQRH